VKPGDAVTLGIRPEEVRLGAGARGADNRLTARVSSVQFQGASTRLVLSGLGEAALTLECDVAAGALADLGVKEGAEVPVALAADALRAFTEPAPGA
jgi:ABC-type Fe3+/spermidine/putrescine transport system ATPase subunit